MSKNTSYLKSNYPIHSPIGIHDREKGMSLSPHNGRLQRKTILPSTIKNEVLPSTEAKRQRENDSDYIDYMAPRVSLYQQKTNKKPLYQNTSPLKPTSTSYQNTLNNNYPSVANGKAQILKQQNLYLTQEIAHLNDLLTEKSKVILNLEKKLQYQVQQQVLTLEQIEREKNKFLVDFHDRDDQQRVQIQRLLIELQHANQQIAALNMELEQVISTKDGEITTLRAAYGEENKFMIQNVIAKKDIQIATLQNQLAQVTQKLQQAANELKTTTQASKKNQQHLNEQIKKLMDQLQNVNHQRKIQLSEQKIAFDNIILTLNKQKEQQVANTIFKCDVELKRYKNLLNQQTLANTHLQRQLQSLKLSHSNQTQTRQHQQNQLKHQIYELQNYYQQKHHNEMEKQREINQKQAKMIEQTIQMKDKEYEEQMTKLFVVNKQQRAEIEKLIHQLQLLRREKKEQIQRVQKINNELRERIVEQSQSTEDQTQTLKVKLGELRHCDITTLKQYYEQQLQLKSQQIMDMEKTIKQSRDKLHKELESKILQRKNHQRLVDDLRIRIGELEIRIAMMTQEHKEKVHSMGSQMEMASMTLIRQTAQKEKYSQQAQSQKRHLQQIITTKDLQIQQLNNKITLLKTIHIQQIQQKQQTIKILQQKTLQVNEQLRRQRDFYQKQIQKKQQQKKQTKQFYEEQLQKQKDTYSRQFSEVTERLMKEKNDLNVKLEHYILVQKQLKDELSLHAEHHEQRTMQQDVARSEEKARLQYSKQTMEISLKNYYQKRITDIQQQLNTTKQLLNEKAQDVRTLTDKNYKLQKKIQKILESQSKMKLLEEKVLALGQESNLVKNVAELGVKGKKKPSLS